MAAPKTSDKPASNATIPPDAEGFAISAAGDLPHCPACKIGLLYTIASDPDATHEAQPPTREGNPNDHPNFVASGGAIRVFCFNCGRGSSHPMKAGG